ncbi:MAG: hypothetical protein ACFB21_01625 [Opitutales bacterium]
MARWCSSSAFTTGDAAGRNLQLLLGVISTVLATLAFYRAAAFVREPAKTQQRWFEPLSGLTTLALYGCLGIAPFF